MNHKTFKFKEGTIVASANEIVSFDMKRGTITETGKFTAALIGGTAPDIKPTAVMDAKQKAQRIFRSEEDAFDAAYRLARGLGYHPTSKKK